jgi:hypothetical protein
MPNANNENMHIFCKDEHIKNEYILKYILNMLFKCHILRMKTKLS